MALGTYTDLKASIAAWLARDDLTDRIPDFITLAEARMSRDLRLREQIKQATGSSSVQSIAIPTDFVEVFRFMLDTEDDIPLEYRPIEDADLRNSGNSADQPGYFSVSGASFKLYPAPDASYTYTIDYYATVPALSIDTETSWLLTKAPDLYLFGALVESAPYLLEDARLSLWESRYQAAKASLNMAEGRAHRTSGPRRMRVVV